MKCPNCDNERMRCRFTVPIGTRTRFRSYRCPKCAHYEETYETSTVLLPPTPEEARTIRAGIELAKAKRYAFTNAKSPTPAA